MAHITVGHADLYLPGTVVASDAFLPFHDGLDAAVDAGATCAIQPGGPMRDDKVIYEATEREVKNDLCLCCALGVRMLQQSIGSQGLQDQVQRFLQCQARCL